MTDALDAEAAASRGSSGTAGARLRAARETAGLSVDAVAQQLKLSPRQVTALEEDDFQRLPGRTFVRGFARNYARFLQLDPDAVLALMPASEAAPALERPTFAAARRTMGEIPADSDAKPSSSRWLFPLFLVIIVAAAGYYEYQRQQGGRRAAAAASSAQETATVGGSSANAPATPAAAPAVGTLSTALPNPVTEQAPAPAEPKDASAAAGGASPAASAATPGTTARAAAVSAVAPGTSAGTPAVPAVAPGMAASTPGAASSAILVLQFRGTSWAEVKDASGRVILQMTGGAGMTQTVTGTAPFELALGNAPEVAVTFRGQSLDLAPYTRGNVARVALK